MNDDFNQFDPFRMMKRMEKVFSNMNKHSGFDKLRASSREPLVDISETKDKVKIIVELPGVDKKDIDLRVKDNNLIIRSTMRKSSDKSNEDTIYSERSFQEYFRSVPLPENTDPNSINAKYNNGILEVILTKLTPKLGKKPNKIEVK